MGRAKDGLKYICKGLINIADKDYTFSLNENKLLLLPIEKYEYRYHTKGIDFFSNFSKQWIIGNSLNTKMGMQKFYIFVDSIYDTPDELEISPQYIITQHLSEDINNSEEPQIDEIYFMSREINTFVQDDFFSYYEDGKLKQAAREMKKFSVNLFDDKCEIQVYNTMQKEFDTDQSSSVISIIELKLKNSVKITDTIKYYKAIYRFLCFVNKRKNINIPMPMLKGKNASAFLNCFDSFNETEFDMGNRYSNISFNCLGEHFPKLLELLSNDDNFKVFYLPKDEKPRGMERYVYTTALFEDVFRKYIVIKHHTQFEIKGRDVIWKNKKSKKGKTIKVTLQEKIQFCIDVYKSKLTITTENVKDMFILPFLGRKCYANYFDDMSKRLSDIRHDIAHGSLKDSEYPNVSSDLMILEMMIYYIVLEHIGLEDDMILFSVCSIFNVGLKYTLFEQIKISKMMKEPKAQ